MITLRSSFGVARQQQDLELRRSGRSSSASRRSISSRAIARMLVVGVAGVAHLARAGQLRADRLEAPERLDDRLEAGQLLPEPPELVGSRG